MVAHQIEARGIRDERVLAAMRWVPRHRFVPAEYRDQAYADGPLPIGNHQTISQPYIVALMTELARPAPGTSVLEIGTGSGYQAAVLAECGAKVCTIEIDPELARRAAGLLVELGHTDVRTRVGDGFDGWAEHAPYDAIVVAAAPERIPPSLEDQLVDGGRLVIPIGGQRQQLIVATRSARGCSKRTVAPVRFVLMTGKAAR